MKKKIFALALACAVSLSLLAGCGANDQPTGGNSQAPVNSDAGTEASAPAANVTIRVGATPAPHVQILEQVVDVLAEQGITLEIETINDYNTPNDGVEDGSLDANYFQHITYMNGYNADNGTHLVSVGEIHYEPLGLYAGKTDSIDALPDGAQIAVPNDTTNEARALQLLVALGIIELKEGVGLEATALDITANPYNVEIVEIEAAQVPRTLQDVDFAVCNGNYALDAGITDQLLDSEANDSEGATAYANVLAVRAGDETRPEIQALVAALTSEEVRSYIEETYGANVVPVF